MTIYKHVRTQGNRHSIKLVLVLVLGFGVMIPSTTVFALDILLGTETVGTFSHFVGRTLCRAINDHTDDLNCQTVPTSGEVDMLTNIQTGSFDLGLVDSRMLHDAIKKLGYFKFLDINYNNLRPLFPLYDKPITLVVRNDAGVVNLDSIKGKRINAGASRSLEKLALKTIFGAKKWTRQDFSLVEDLPKSQSQDTFALCQGSVQVIIHVGIHPDAKLKQVFNLCNVKLANMSDSDIENMLSENPSLSALSLPVDIYPGQRESVTTFGSSVMLITSASMDKESLQKIMEALIANSDRVSRIHPALGSFSPETMQ